MTGGGALAELLDARIKQVCASEQSTIDTDLLEGAIGRVLDAKLNDLIDARIRAVFAGRAKA